MEINVDQFILLLDKYGIRHKRSHRSVTVNNCPACGSTKFKVAFDTGTNGDGLLAKCYRGACGEGYSAKKYLRMIGASVEDIEALTGMSAESALENMTLTTKVDEMEKKFQEPPATFSYAEAIKEDERTFFNFEAIGLDSPISIYAQRRGVDFQAHKNLIKGCIKDGSVVFLVIERGEVIGYQKRFINPPSPHFKTKTAPGFKVHENILVFPKRGGDIWICEGPFTALSAWHYGHTGVCTFGSGISTTQLQKIQKIAGVTKSDIGICDFSMAKKIGVAFDPDEAGEKGALKIIKFFYGAADKIYRVLPETGADLNDSLMNKTGFVVQYIEQKDPSIPDLFF